MADFLAGDLIKFLREHIPFFEVTDDGRVFFGDWYHRREFGQLSVFARTINQVTPEQQVILPQLEAFAADPDNYLDHQVDALQKKLYQEVNRLHAKLESAQAEPVAAPQPSSGSTLRGLFKNFIDPAMTRKTPRQAPPSLRSQPTPRRYKASLPRPRPKPTPSSTPKSASCKSVPPSPAMNTPR